MGTEIVGWTASAVLLLTLGRQVYSQWRSGQTQGISSWLFIGQLAASTGFAIYSWLLANWVFLFTNLALLLTAVIGELIYLRNRRRSARTHKQAPQGGSLSHLAQEAS